MRVAIVLVSMCLLATGCATTPNERMARGQESCLEKYKADRMEGRECFYELYARFHIPVKCTNLFLDGKPEEAQSCTQEAKEAAINARQAKIEAQEEWRFQHPVDLSPELQYLGNSMRRKPTSAPKDCSSATDSFGVTQTRCQ